MGTTTNRAIPYPDASLPIGLANEHQQDLAEWLDEDLEHSRFEDENWGQSVANTGADIVQDWVGLGTMQGGWTFDGGNNRWLYSGPDALFLVCLQTTFNVDADGGVLANFVRGGDHPDFVGFAPVCGQRVPISPYSSRVTLNCSGIVHCGPTGYGSIDSRVVSNLDSPLAPAAVDNGAEGPSRISCVRLRSL